MLRRIVQTVLSFFLVVSLILGTFLPVRTIHDVLTIFAISLIVSGLVALLVLYRIGRMDVQEFERTFWKFAKYATLILLTVFAIAAIVLGVIMLM